MAILVLGLTTLLGCTDVKPHPVPTPDAAAVGPAGGTVATADGNIRVEFPAGSASTGTRVVIGVDTTPVGAESAPALVPLKSFDVQATSGTVQSGRVTVRYDPVALTDGGGQPGLLVMLIDDHNGGWVALPTDVDAAAQTASAQWPRFSKGVLGYLPSPARWLVDHVLTEPLGPKKKPNCDKKKKWLGADKGWTADNPNWNGGRILLNPLDSCVEKARETGGTQHAEVTNRYWYSMVLSLRDTARIDNADALDATGLGDALLTEAYWRLFDVTLVPGHSFAHLEVRNEPAGQRVSFNSYADPVSFVVDALISVTEAATLGEAREVRASLVAAEGEVYAGLKAGTETNTSIAEKLAPGSPWRRDQEAKLPPGSKTLEKFEQGLNGYALVNCAVDTLKDRVSRDGHDETGSGSWGRLKSLLTTAIDKCKIELLSAALGKAYQAVDPNDRDRLVGKVIKGLLDTKSLQATSEGIDAILARTVGKDYLRSRLILTQARDPRFDPFAGVDWDKSARPLMGCSPPSGESWDHLAVSVQRADVTGDGLSEAIVQSECPTTTSSNPDEVIVFDGNSPGGRPQSLGRLPQGQEYFRDAKVTPGKKSITLDGQALSPKTALCCPDRRLAITYTWKNGHFVQTKRKDRPL